MIEDSLLEAALSGGALVLLTQQTYKLGRFSGKRWIIQRGKVDAIKAMIAAMLGVTYWLGAHLSDTLTGGASRCSGPLWITLIAVGAAAAAGFQEGRQQPMTLDEARTILDKFGKEATAGHSQSGNVDDIRFAAKRMMELPVDGGYREALHQVTVGPIG